MTRREHYQRRLATLAESRWWFGRRFWIVFCALIAAFIFLAGDYGLYTLWGYRRQASALQREIATLEQEQQILATTKHMLEVQDRAYIEQIAREKYGMVKKGETLYRVRDRVPPQP